MTVDLNKLRLVTQAVIAVLVLVGATVLAAQHVIDSDAVIALYGFAAGAVGAGSIGGVRGRHDHPTLHQRGHAHHRTQGFLAP